ncbi:hypothetical protein Tco_1163040, partial [Tanacetum coccineum]
KFPSSPTTWLKFYNRDYTRESKKEYKATYKVLMKKETEVPEALDLINFGTIHGGRTLQELDEFCRLLSYHHLDHTYFDGTQYTYVPNIPDLGVHHGVNFMSNPQTYFTAPPDPSANPFGLFGDVPSTFHHCENDMDEE